MFPDEIPHKVVGERPKRYKSLRSFLVTYLKTEGFYSYAKYFEWHTVQAEDYYTTVNRAKSDVLGTFKAVWGDAVGWVITVETFLANVHNNPEYRLPVQCEETKKRSK